MPNLLRLRGLQKAARTRAFEALLAERGVSLTVEEALDSTDLALVAAAAHLAPKKVLSAITDKIELRTSLNTKADDRADLILFIELSRRCTGGPDSAAFNCASEPRRCHACLRTLELYEDLGLTVPEHLK